MGPCINSSSAGATSRTRYIALVTIISVMLGVAAMIATNAVMGGAKQHLQDRLHGILSDLVFSSRMSEGIPDADGCMAQINRIAGEYIEGMSPTVALPALLSFTVGGQSSAKQVMIVGIDENSYARVSDIGDFLQHPDNRKHLDFQLKESGYDEINHEVINPSKAVRRPQLPSAGWVRRRNRAACRSLSARRNQAVRPIHLRPTSRPA